MAAWSDAKVWEAMESHRWYPPSSTRVTAENYELAVTPGSSGLTWIYGFHAPGIREAERLLGEIREKVRSLGGTGARIQLGPRTRPPGLAEALSAFQFRAKEPAELLAYDLLDESGAARFPSFRSPAGVSVREIATRKEYDAVDQLTATIFGLPPMPTEVRAGIIETYERQLRETGHSDRFLAFDGEQAVGTAGLTLEGAVALFWGTGVLPAFRGRGIYGELVSARCRTARERGAEIAIVGAQTGTSGPILKGHGFRVVGPMQVFEAEWTTVHPSG